MALDQAAPSVAQGDELSFVSGTNAIKRTLVDASADTTEDDALRFIGSAEFSGEAGKLRLSSSLVESDGIAALQITLLGTPEIVATDFLL